MDRLELINALTRQVEGVADSGFPLEVFPQKMQRIILEWSLNEHYVKEYAAMAMLSAIAAALGNALHVRIHSQWVSNSAMYCIFVGRPGLGKTPPLYAAFSPIRKKDAELIRIYNEELEKYEAKGKGMDDTDTGRPKIVRYIINDFTPEAMLEAHHNNPRGIVILVDEIIGMFNSANRYNSGQLIEQLLSAWSGTAISIIRRSNPKPLVIEHPCINIIGTIQTKLVDQLVTKGYADNGLLDRMIFVYPKSQKIEPWTAVKNNNTSPSASQQWENIIYKVFALENGGSLEIDKKEQKILEFNNEAESSFQEWWNARIAEVNSIENDDDVDTRVMKRNTVVARLALLLQVSKWACGEGHVQFVDEASVEGAIVLNDYLEDCFVRVKDHMAADDYMAGKEIMLEAMGETFTTNEAQAYGKKIGVTSRTVLNWLREFTVQGKVLHGKRGNYQKVMAAEDETETETDTSVSSFSSLSNTGEHDRTDSDALSSTNATANEN